MKTVSAVFHPLTLASYMTLIFYFTAPQLIGSVSINRIPILVAVVFLTTFLIPLLGVGLLRMTRRVSGLELIHRRERILPFLVITLFYAVASYMLIAWFRVSPVFASILITITSLIFTLLVITFWFKISIHGAANWSSVGILAYLVLSGEQSMYHLLWVSILVAGIVSSSRLYLGYHTPREIWSGCIYGFMFSFWGLWALVTLG